jgi:hypothetical protein
MTMPNLKSALVVLALAIAALPAAAAGLDTQKNTERSVTVAVTPQSLADGAASWDFKIVLDTHSADLSDDLVKSAILIDTSGNRHAPAAWEGAGPGGHHREGVLRFKPISPRPRSVELQITRSGEAAPRVFRWQLN